MVSKLAGIRIILCELFYFTWYIYYLSTTRLSGLLLAVGLASAVPLSSPGSPRFLDLSSSPLCQGLFFLPICQQSSAPAVRFVDLCSGPLAGLLPFCQNDTPANRKESLRILNNLPICNGPLAGFIPFCQSTDNVWPSSIFGKKASMQNSSHTSNCTSALIREQ